LCSGKLADRGHARAALELPCLDALLNAGDDLIDE
jgi:hypothetical protein